jgi:hypothetical protein
MSYKNILLSISKANVLAHDLNVQAEALRALCDSVNYELTGPNPKPVFLPLDKDAQIDQNRMGILLLPTSYSAS